MNTLSCVIYLYIAEEMKEIKVYLNSIHRFNLKFPFLTEGMFKRKGLNITLVDNRIGAQERRIMTQKNRNSLFFSFYFLFPFANENISLPFNKYI